MIELQEEQEQQESAARLIRALSIREESDDHAAWTARWTALLQQGSVEDAEAAIADLTIQCTRIQDRLGRIQRGEGTDSVREGVLIHLGKVRRAQLRFVSAWVKNQDRLASALVLNEAQAKLIAARAEAARASAAAAETADVRAAMRLQGKLATQQRLAESEAARLKAADKVRTKKLVIVEREREIAREWIESVRETVPDGTDTTLMLQATVYVAKMLHRKLEEAGVPGEEHLDEYTTGLENAVRRWIRAEALERAVLEIDARWSSDGHDALEEGVRS